MDKPVGEDGESELINFIENEDAVVPFNSVQQRLLEEDISLALNELSEREASIIKLRLALKEPKSHLKLGEFLALHENVSDKYSRRHCGNFLIPKTKTNCETTSNKIKITTNSKGHEMTFLLI